jgi:hypothetical protein
MGHSAMEWMNVEEMEWINQWGWARAMPYSFWVKGMNEGMNHSLTFVGLAWTMGPN